MKELLLITLFVGNQFLTFGQNLQNQNFNGLAVGNVTTSIGGTVAGQGGYILYSINGTAPTTTTSAAVTNAQIIDSGSPNSLSLLLNGPNGSGGASYVWANSLPASWAARTAGNNIIEIEVDVYTNVVTTSKNYFGVDLYNAATDKILAGFYINGATKELLFNVYSIPTGATTASNVNYNLAAAPGIVMPTNSIVRIGVSFNKTTGVATIKAPGLPTTGVSIIGSAIGIDPAEIDFTTFSGSTATTPNTSSSSMTFDNLLVKATATDTLLKNNEFFQTNFSIYPNPTTDIVNISNLNNIAVKSISISDVNGRIVKEIYSNDISSVSTANLTPGVYFLKIVSNESTGTTKLIKN